VTAFSTARNVDSAPRPAGFDFGRVSSPRWPRLTSRRHFWLRVVASRRLNTLAGIHCAGPAGSVRGALQLAADPPGLSPRDAEPPCPSGPRERHRPTGGCHPWGASADPLARSNERTPTRWPAPRSPTTGRDPSRSHHRAHAAGQSVAATRGPPRARTPRPAPEPRKSRPRCAGPASRTRPPAVATATGALGRAVSRGAGGRPSAASGPGSGLADGRCPRYPPAQIRRPATRVGP
jgi:hypothetical protein